MVKADFSYYWIQKILVPSKCTFYFRWNWLYHFASTKRSSWGFVFAKYKIIWRLHRIPFSNWVKCWCHFNPRNWISSAIHQFRTFFCYSDKMFGWKNILFKARSRTKVLFNHISDWFSWSNYHVYIMLPRICLFNPDK